MAWDAHTVSRIEEKVMKSNRIVGMRKSGRLVRMRYGEHGSLTDRQKTMRNRYVRKMHGGRRSLVT